MKTIHYLSLISLICGLFQFNISASGLNTSSVRDNIGDTLKKKSVKETVKSGHVDSLTQPADAKATVLPDSNQEIILTPETTVQFIGGQDSFIRFIENNLRYPDDIREAGIDGVVHVLFVVDTFGHVSHIKIERSSGSKKLDSEAIRLVKKMDKHFKPARMNGKPVKAYARLPLIFEVDD